MVEIHIIKELKLITNKPECIYGLTLCKFPISSETIKYRYKFKSNQTKKIPQKCLYGPPQGVYQVQSNLKKSGVRVGAVGLYKSRGS